MFNRSSANPVASQNIESNINYDLVDAVQYTTRFLSAVGRYHHVSCTEYFVPSYSLVFNDNFAARSEGPNNKLVFDRGGDAQEDQIEVNELIPVKLPKALVEKAEALIVAQEQAALASKYFHDDFKDFAAINSTSRRLAP